MSQENGELALCITDALEPARCRSRGRALGPEGAWHPVFEETTEGRTYRGHAGVRRYYADLAEFCEENHAEVTDVRDLGDQVLGLGHLWFKFASGVELDQEGAFLHTWRNGKCVEARTWLSHAEAPEAAGLSD